MRLVAAGIMVGAVLASPLPTTESADAPAAIAVISRAEIATTMEPYKWYPQRAGRVVLSHQVTYD